MHSGSSSGRKMNVNMFSSSKKTRSCEKSRSDGLAWVRRNNITMSRQEGGRHSLKLMRRKLLSIRPAAVFVPFWSIVLRMCVCFSFISIVQHPAGTLTTLYYTAGYYILTPCNIANLRIPSLFFNWKESSFWGGFCWFGCVYTTVTHPPALEPFCVT